jgi:hypothetical protein
VSDSDEIEREVAVAALGGWEKTLEAALERYCRHCRSLPKWELQRRPKVLIDFNLWVDPKEAARGNPLGGLSLEGAVRVLTERVQRGSADPYAILGALARECEK